MTEWFVSQVQNNTWASILHQSLSSIFMFNFHIQRFFITVFQYVQICFFQFSSPTMSNSPTRQGDEFQFATVAADWQFHKKSRHWLWHVMIMFIYVYHVCIDVLVVRTWKSNEIKWNREIEGPHECQANFQWELCTCSNFDWSHTSLPTLSRSQFAKSMWRGNGCTHPVFH